MTATRHPVDPEPLPASDPGSGFFPLYLLTPINHLLQLREWKEMQPSLQGVDMAVSDQIREAIQNSGVSMYALSKATGVTHPVLSRFVRGERGLTTGTVDTLCEFFQMHLTKPKRPKREG